MEISSDKNMNSALKKEIQGMRGGFVEMAEKVSMPARFTTVPHPDKPAVILTDSETGKSVDVSLYAYSKVREVLSTLFD